MFDLLLTKYFSFLSGHGHWKPTYESFLEDDVILEGSVIVS